jgi:hypothetical protein
MESPALVTQTLASRKIDLLGGTFKLAKLLGENATTISNWRKNGIPKPWDWYLCLRYRKKFKEGGVL